MTELPELHKSEILKYGLFTKRRFFPLFMAQFLGAFNDNLLRSGLVVLIAYSAEKGIKLHLQPEILVTLCSALLIIPFILFSSIAGPLADKYEKARLVTYTKLAEVGIMLVVLYGFYTHSVYLLMFMLFVSGTHSTFFGPIKYSMLPELMKEGELLAANGFIAAGSYLGILGGLISGGLLIEDPNNAIGWTALAIAVAGLILSLFIPRTQPAEPDTHISFHPIRGLLLMWDQVRQDKRVVHAILALSWFLLVGSVFMSQFPNYARSVVRGDNEVYTLFLTIFSIGIALGSVACDKLLKGEITPRLLPMAALGISFFSFGMVYFTPIPTHEGLQTFWQFIADVHHWPVLACMLMVAICGGIYMVPLYAILQSRSHNNLRSRVIAASNVCDALYMTVAAIICAILLSLGMGVVHLFALVAALNLVAASYARKMAQ